MSAAVMRLGLAGGPLPATSDGMTDDLIGWLAGRGVRSLAVHLADREVLLSGAASRIRAMLADADIRVAQSTGYQPCLVDPDMAVRREAQQRLRAGIAVAEALGAVMVNTGVGSRHATFPYGPDPRNHDATAIETLVEHLRWACIEADDRGLLLSLEPHLLTTIGDVATIAAVMDAVDHPALRVNFDPTNLLGTLPDVYTPAPLIRSFAAGLAGRISPSAHVKDIRPRPELVLHLDEVPPGEGYMDWTAYFEVCRTLGDEAALIVEHLHGDQVERSLDVVASLAVAHGIELA